jgi:rubrerythrin
MFYGGNHKKTQCNICYSENETEITVKPKCDHYFCEECIYKSINMYYNDRFILKDNENKPKCPVCRANF